MHKRLFPSPAWRWPVVEFDDRALAALKWLALALMLLDHVNKYIHGGAVLWMSCAGRVSMPLFALVLGCNLARPGAWTRGAYRRTAQRLAVFAILATPAFVGAGHVLYGWYPLNMMFALLIAVLMLWTIELGGRWLILSCLLFAWGGLLVEFWWAGIGLVLGVWAYRRRPSGAAALGVAASMLLLCLINGNGWALLVVPVAMALRHWRWPLPQARLFFYAFYPAHLWLLWAVVAWSR